MRRLFLLAAAFLFVGTIAGCKRKAPTAPAVAVVAVSKTVVPVASVEKVDVKTFQISGPTIIAFFPTTQAEIDKDANGPDEENETLGDFQNYLFEMMQPLQDAHIRVEESYEPAFRVEVDGKLITFNAKAIKYGYGYYFLEPGNAPHVVTDMLTDGDFQQESKDYFGIVVADPKSDNSGTPKSDSSK